MYDYIFFIKTISVKIEFILKRFWKLNNLSSLTGLMEKPIER